MNVKYFKDADTLDIEFRVSEIAHSQDLDEVTLGEFEAQATRQGMKTRERASYAEAAENHLLDALHATHAARWRWLQQAMAFGFDLAKTRAARGLVTLGPHGEVMWSALHAELFAAEQRLPNENELAHLI